MRASMSMLDGTPVRPSCAGSGHQLGERRRDRIDRIPVDRQSDADIRGLDGQVAGDPPRRVGGPFDGTDGAGGPNLPAVGAGEGNGTEFLDGQSVIIAGSDLADSGAGGDDCLVLGVVTEGNDRAIGLQRQREVPLGGDSDKVIAGRDGTLAVCVVTPCDEGAVVFEGQAMIVTGGDGLEIGSRRGVGDELVGGVEAPDDD